MIAYQVPTVMRHLSSVQVFEEEISSFLAAGIFSYLADTGTALTAEALYELTDSEDLNDIHDALVELQIAQLIEQVKITGSGDIDGMLADLSGEVSA